MSTDDARSLSIGVDFGTPAPRAVAVRNRRSAVRSPLDRVLQLLSDRVDALSHGAPAVRAIAGDVNRRIPRQAVDRDWSSDPFAVICGDSIRRGNAGTLTGHRSPAVLIGDRPITRASAYHRPTQSRPERG